MNTAESPFQLYQVWKSSDEVGDAHMALAALSLMAVAGNAEAQRLVDMIDRENSVPKPRRRLTAAVQLP